MDKRRQIFVFGSNLAGVHGAGAARVANLRFGAKMGEGWGFHGNSYALPTKDMGIRTLPLMNVKSYVEEFKQFATKHPELDFMVTRIGCGLAGYSDMHIAPMFKASPKNCIFDVAWRRYLGEGYTYHEGDL